MKSFNWHESFAHTYQKFTQQIFEIAPQLLGAITIFITGWVIANLMRLATKKLIEGLDTIFKRAAKIDGIKQERLKSSYATIISGLVFWTILLFFIAATVNMLGWKMLSGWMDSIINHLPHIITGLLIILAGFLLGNSAKITIMIAADASGIEQSRILGLSAQILIILTTFIIGAGQVGINVYLLNNILIVIIGVLLAGGAFAFSLGAKTLVANIIGSQYVRKHCRIGEEMTIKDITGVIAEVTQTSIILDTDNGRTIIPAKDFQEHIAHFSSMGKNSEGT